MSNALRRRFDRYLSGVSRRQLLRTGGLLGAAGAIPALRGTRADAAPARELASSTSAGPSIYEKIGVHPVINCRGTYTVIGGSLELPEVTSAQQAAAQHYVQLDELADGVGARLAELTGAEWGMVSSGCAAGLAHSTAACVAGGNPDLHVRIPDLRGFAKDEVVIPAHSRNEYDAAVRSIGVRIVEVANEKEFLAALGPRVAMVYVLAGPNAETGPLTYDMIYPAARERNIPVLVDAAAEILTIPNVHLKRGATLVGYSGGKCLRGPQSAGLILGRKDLLKAAWVHSAPHHGYGRAMKVGKEEAMGMLAAVEAWTKRDHQAEWAMWMSWMNHIAAEVSSIDGVTTAIEQTKELSNQSPVLNIRWDTEKIGVSGSEVEHTLFTTEPRVTLFGRGGRRRGQETPANQTGVSITAYMMCTGDEKVVADRLRSILSSAVGTKLARDTSSASSQIAGEWTVSIEFAASRANHVLYLQQDGSAITGTHQGDFLSRDLTGSLHGDKITMTSSIGEQHGAALTYTFTGTVSQDGMGGDLSLGEYRSAKWTAVPRKRDLGGPGWS
ncbi:MAG: Cys/Met metabolism pyridoxal-phosphate-dependent protein [Acidobacteriaceae bacterium]|nr:Cys/Met metabolism pyridoxal-phosphate-dependent protein [Acidobacteriaceae bacterium]